MAMRGSGSKCLRTTALNDFALPVSALDATLNQGQDSRENICPNCDTTLYAVNYVLEGMLTVVTH